MSLLHDKWYALSVRANHEAVVEHGLGERGYAAFVPTISWRRRWSDRSKVTRRPMFAGYVFCRYDETVTHRMVDTPAVQRIVGFGGLPMPVDADELDAIRIVSHADRDVEAWPRLREGERVRILSGPLQGVEGVFIRHKDHDRLIVQVTLLQRAVSVQVDNDAVSPLSA